MESSALAADDSMPRPGRELAGSSNYRVIDMEHNLDLETGDITSLSLRKRGELRARREVQERRAGGLQHEAEPSEEDEDDEEDVEEEYWEEQEGEEEEDWEDEDDDDDDGGSDRTEARLAAARPGARGHPSVK